MYAPAPGYGAPGYGAPGYGAPPPPAYYPPPAQQNTGPTIINLSGNNNSGGSPCRTCGKDTDNLPRKKVGCVAIAWCLCLLFTVGAWGLCLYPLFNDGCKDTELVCIRCQTLKSTIPANCC